MKQSIEEAQRVVADLRKRFDDIEIRAMALHAERDEISYTALVDKNSKAVRRLAEVNTELLTVASEGDTVRAALTEAVRRVAEHEAALRGELEQLRAVQAKKLGVEMAALGKALDQSGRDFLGYLAFRNVMLELSRLGPSIVPSIALVDSICKRAFTAMAMGSPLQWQHLAPDDRRSFTELSEKWLHGVETWSSARLEQKDAA